MREDKYLNRKISLIRLTGELVLSCHLSTAAAVTDSILSCRKMITKALDRKARQAKVFVQMSNTVQSCCRLLIQPALFWLGRAMSGLEIVC